jgi:hypothetical protein
MSEIQVSVLDQIKLIIAGANPDDLKKMPMLGKIHEEVIRQDEEKRNAIAELLKALVGKLGMQEKQNATLESFAKNYLRTLGYKKFVKRGGGSGQKRKQKAPITEDKVNEAKKRYNSGKGEDLRKIAKEMNINTNSLKKHLGIPKMKKSG